MHYQPTTVLAMVTWLMLASSVRAQPAFAPPPPPSGAPSAVRGIYNPAQTPPSPARVAPPIQAPPRDEVRDPSITPTPSAGAKRLQEGEIVARVDGQIILASDVLWQVNQIIEANRQRIPPQEIDKARQVLLRQQTLGLIDTQLLYADFRRNVPAENLPSIEKNLVKPFEEQEVPRLLKMLKLKNRRALAAFFAENGTSLADVQRQFGERTIAGEWLRQMTPKPRPVTHEEMLSFYEERKEEYAYPAQARWEEVMIRFDRVGGDRSTAYKMCADLGNEIWQKVSQNPQFRGEAFTEIAVEKSHGFTAREGGKHDWTTKGALRCQAIDDALFSLQVGQMSNIIESEQGFHIVRVLQRKDVGRTPFTEAQAEIREQLEKERQQQLVEAEIIKLRRKSRVWTVFDGDLTGRQLEKMLEGRQRR
ncbi:MAG: peptidylprolyl isomerase [Pirellulales bacterium]|nr:peptidylprolyl isomerase [Pirellulales bacterium]